MLEVYSVNQAVAANSPVAFTAKSLRAGCSVAKADNYTILLRKPGIYKVSMSGSFTGSLEYPIEAGVASIALSRDGNIETSTARSVTVAADTTYELSTDKLIKVDPPLPGTCFTPIALTVMNTGVAVTFTTVSLNVIKVA